MGMNGVENCSRRMRFDEGSGLPEFFAYPSVRAKELGVTVAKYRGDEERDFVAKEFAVESFPSISVFKGGKMTKYTSEARDTASLRAFVEANV